MHMQVWMCSNKHNFKMDGGLDLASGTDYDVWFSSKLKDLSPRPYCGIKKGNIKII